jgi:hypothetical protein
LLDVESVFNRLRKYNWKLKLTKCKFAQEKIEYLGHVVSQNQIGLHPRNLEKIKQLKRPKNLKELQAVLGLINYYRRFIQGLTYIIQPLLLNLKKRDNYIWENEQEEAFINVLNLLIKEPILKLPDYEKEFILKTDASGVGFGGALVQVHDNIEHPVSFFSGSFTKSQAAGWNHWQKEAFAVFTGVSKFEHYLRSKPFTIVTDNGSLLQLLKPNKELTNPMLTRWNLWLSSFSYKIIHRPGAKLVIEDGLSRSQNFYGISLIDIKQKQKEDMLIQTITSLMSNTINENATQEDLDKAKMLTDKFNKILLLKMMRFIILISDERKKWIGKD